MTTPDGEAASIEVRDNPAAGQYEILVDGELAGRAEYRDRVGRRIFVHTKVDDRFAGRGLGNHLAKGALDQAIASGMRVVPRCPFIRSYVERHAEYRRALEATPPG